MATLVRVDQTLEIPDQLPTVALRDLVFFPYMVLPLLIGRPASLRALQDAEADTGYLLLLTQRDVQVEEPDEEDTYRIGTVVKILEVSRLPDGNARVVLEGLGRARVKRFLPTEVGLRTMIEPFVGGDPDGTVGQQSEEMGSDEEEALARGVVKLYQDYVRLNERLPDDLISTVREDSEHGRLSHLVSGHLLVVPSEKQELLESASVGRHLTLLREILVREIEILRIEEKLDAHIRHQMDTDRRDSFLQDQLHSIHSPGETPDHDEWAELVETLRNSKLPASVRERAQREMARLQKLNPVAPEAAVIRTYLDWITALPWASKTADNLDVDQAATVLDDAHYGLGEVKERILDHIAVLSLVGELRGPILCLVGPPGVGKTSLGQSIADALAREFVRVSLGGVRDEAEIRGHRRTYVGALPGRVLQGMRRSGSVNPVFMLDEIDKLARDFHGDPGAALLEVLDPEQNKAFNDHYLELDYDLSNVLFVATANTLGGIPDALRDRMEIIRLPGYLDTEKRKIALDFLWPRQAGRHGLDVEEVQLSAEGAGAIISRYTREAGVRELDRRLSRIARKLARQQATDRVARARAVGPDDLRELLGPPPYQGPGREDEGDRAGIANGLAWTEAGGEVLDVEVAVLPGSGKIELTGTLGDVMKESAKAAMTYARSRAELLGLDAQFYRDVDIHIHIPEGATPKDGPSAGITIASAIISALTRTPTRRVVAMTGEITLRGRVLAVGGIKEKAVAAMRNGMKTVILPADNAAELELLPKEVLDSVEFIPVRAMDEVLGEVLVQKPEKHRPTDLGPLGPQLQQ
jgi:ATP-dependent Lon protease